MTNIFHFNHNYSKTLFCLNNKYGFHKKLSANHTVIDITSKIQNPCGKGNFAYGVFVDFKKVFVTVNRDSLINKLNHNSIIRTEFQ